MDTCLIDGFVDVSAVPLENRFSQTPYGPSSKAICKVSNGNTCGSGTLVGKRNGKSLVLTNAHVAGNKPGHEVILTFPFLENQRFRSRTIMSAYSDRVMMDWNVQELEEEVPLPHTKLANTVPQGGHYTGGYPRCRGPYFQQLTTRNITHNGTVWHWQPPSVGGQSGSGVHSLADDLVYGLLTWLWNGNGAGQTTRSIWLQYVTRQAFGAERTPDYIELGNRAPDNQLEPGVFMEANITTLPIWAHMDDPPTDPGNPGPGDPDPDPEFVRAVLERAQALYEQSQLFEAKSLELVELVRKYKPDSVPDGGNEDGDGLFGLKPL